MITVADIVLVSRMECKYMKVNVLGIAGKKSKKRPKKDKEKKRKEEETDIFD